MAKCELCLLGLIILSSLSTTTGTSGVNKTNVFISSGENVRLPCNNALPDCTLTTWIYNRFRHSEAVELITEGIKKKDTERHERLSLESDCSLNIKNVTKEDSGLYTCRQFVNGRQQGTDTQVYLHVLHVSVSPSSSSSSSSSSSQTEISPGHSLTLFCQLYLYDNSTCVNSDPSEGLHLLWVNQAGVDLTTDSRYQISSDHCIINLTTTLLNEDDNREWRCQLTRRNQLQSSVRYTVKYSAQDDSTTPVNPVLITNSQDPSTIKTGVSKAQDDSTTAVNLVHNTNSQDPSTTNTPETKAQDDSTTTVNLVHNTNSTVSTTEASPQVIVIVIVTAVASVAVLLPLILWLIRKKRAGNRRETDESVEQTDDHVTYTEVTASNKNQDKKNKVRCDDKVIYSSIKGATAGSQENFTELYASVNKNHQK